MDETKGKIDGQNVYIEINSWITLSFFARLDFDSTQGIRGRTYRGGTGREKQERGICWLSGKEIKFNCCQNRDDKVAKKNQRVATLDSSFSLNSWLSGNGGGGGQGEGHARRAGGGGMADMSGKERVLMTI